MTGLAGSPGPTILLAPALAPMPAPTPSPAQPLAGHGCFADWLRPALNATGALGQAMSTDALAPSDAAPAPESQVFETARAAVADARVLMPAPTSSKTVTASVVERMASLLRASQPAERPDALPTEPLPVTAPEAPITDEEAPVALALPPLPAALVLPPPPLPPTLPDPTDRKSVV